MPPPRRWPLRRRRTAQLVIDKEGQLQIDLNQNSWKLVDIIDWKGTPGEN